MHNEIQEDYQSKSFMNIAKKGYFYLGRGLDETRRWQSLIIGILGLAAVTKITSIWLIATIFISSSAILIVIGHFLVHRVSRMMDYLGIKFGSHFATKSFDYVEAQYKLLEEIRDMMAQKKIK